MISFKYPNVLKYWDTQKIINFPFVSNGKFIIFRCPTIWAHHSLIIMCLDTRGYQKVLSLTWKEPEIWIYSALFFNVVPFQLHTLVPSSFPVINTRSVEVNILVP